MDDIKSVSIKDTNGSLSEDIIKIYLEKSSLNAWLTDGEDGRRTLKLSPSNVRFDSVPNINGSTYKTFLAYNGSLGYSNKIFSTVVADASGIFVPGDLPVLEYDPSTVVKPDLEELEDVVIDIKMYNGTVDVLNYSEGILSNGEKSYFVKSRRAYPTQVTSLPNVAGSKVYMDGWYSYTTIIFRPLIVGAVLSEGNFYGYEGFIFKASDNGILSKSIEGDLYIMREGDTVVKDGVMQVENADYEGLLFTLNETTGLGAMGNNVYLHSQVLVMDEIRDAITKEAVEQAFADDQDYIDFQNWQKLTLKRASAYIMFQNELFENAQILLESARAFCTKGRYNFNCK
jgi:hypothetical protein